MQNISDIIAELKIIILQVNIFSKTFIYENSYVFYFKFLYFILSLFYAYILFFILPETLTF